MEQSTLQNIFEEFLTKKSLFINKDALTISYNPDNIPHRDRYINALAKVLAPCLRLEKPSNIFIYGKTGTGKTCVVQHVCRQLIATALTKQKPVKTIYINCKMKKVADTEYRLVAQLCKEVGRVVPATGLPTNEIYKIFFETIDKKKQIMILILDEVDALVKKCGDGVLYNLTRVNNELNNTKVGFIGISNDVTFKDNLDARVKSSLNDEELVFPPYDALQLKDILSNRAKLAFANNSITDDVISKCAAYAAREHGDARRALDLLRVSGEVAEREGSPQVSENHVDAAQDKLETDSVFEIIKHMPRQSQVILYASFSLSKSKEGSLYTGEIFNLYSAICSKIGLKCLTQRRFSDLISELVMLGLFDSSVVSKGRYGRTRELDLKINPEVQLKILNLFEKELGVLDERITNQIR